MKRLIFLIVVAILLQTGVTAEETKLYSDPETEIMVEKLIKLGVFKQKDGVFFGDSEPLKRYEAAQMFMNLTGMENPGASEYISNRFLDVPEYYEYAGEINAAVSQGIMSGTGNGLFEPEKEITGNEFLKCMVELLGYGGMASAKGGYPSGYLAVAADLRLTKNVSSVSDKAISRGNAVKIMYNALEVPVNEIKSLSSDSVEYTVDNDKTLLEKYHNIYKEKGVVINNDIMTMNEYYKPNDTKVRIGDYTLETNDGEIWSKIGYKVEFYYKENKKDDENTLVDFAVMGINEENIVSSRDIVSFSAGEIKYDDNDREKKIKVSPDASIFYNGSLLTENISSCADDLEGDILTVDNDGDGYADFVSVTNYTYYDKVTATDLKNDKIVGSDKTNEYSNTKYLKITDANGNAKSFADIAKGDIVAVAESMDGKCTVIKILKLNGNITLAATDDDEIITADGKRYTVSARLTEKQKSKLKIGAEVGAALCDDMVVYVGDAVETLKIGYLIYCREDSSKPDGEAWIRILTSDGTVTKHLMNEKVKLNGTNVKREKIPAMLENIKSEYNLAGDGKTSQVVRYQIDDKSYVTEMYTLNAAADSKLALKYNYNERGLAYLRDHGYGTAVFANSCAITSTIPVFRVPQTNQEAYDDKFFTVISYNTSNFKDGGKFEFDSYAKTEDEIEPDAIVYYNVSTTEVKKTADLFLVEKYDSALDNEGNAARRIKGAYYDGKKEYFIDDEVAMPEIGVGDVVAFALDAADCIVALNLVYDYSENKINPDYVGTSIQDTVCVKLLHVYNAPDGKNFVETYDETLANGIPGPDKMYMFNFRPYTATKKQLFVFNTETEKVSVGRPEFVTDYKHDTENYDLILIRYDTGYLKDAVFYQK